MKIATHNTIAPYKAPAATPTTPDTVAPSASDEFKASKPSSILKSAALGALYGGAVGTASGVLYTHLDLPHATMVHMGGIVAGAAGGAAVFGKTWQPKVEAPASYALGALAGAGATWGTSAFGLLHNPVVAGVTGALLGGFYGGIAAFIANQGALQTTPTESKATDVRGPAPAENGSPTPANNGTPASEPPVNNSPVSEGAWNGLAIAYGVGGGVMAAAVAAGTISGHLSAGAACGGAAVAGLALLNGYMLKKEFTN